ncbi:MULTISPECIES: DUF1641 domain-containing protein [unclassified Thermoactinomyces]|jgi:uncharacterized protein YjgD (DUF1641 family)|uniref:DUF1641 domain-containing protein n=1 Tax=unclassified Thermoactinomyces TaxID=2634588 RepID=UPI0018DD0A81|nr:MULTISPECIES: DUF1641 domain-containing protein [unclassified Thermoactinomyces]MBH8599625.1 DUF1641 domain-containing protein [Thermoactinomyces sp. CICC 10523]MBH8605739.1 DUF1641 domain-containing protein [Thermoactinomyces sp. CICC 10522]MBH8609207.1 DUF1641 domain-containing protein [Thermoactinomyces sp. CICC 10521]
MANPISVIKKRVLSEEEKKQQSLNQLKADLAENETALKKTLELVRELHDSGILEAVQAILKAKEEIAKITVSQLTRKPVINIINNLMGAAGTLAEIDPELTQKLLKSVASGMEEAGEHLQKNKKVGIFDLVKVLSDPDINRAISFSIHFLKGMGKGLKGR